VMDSDVLMPVFEGQRGHPVRFAPVCGDVLAQLQGPQGAGMIVSSRTCLQMAVTDVGCVMDIDTLDDLRRAERLVLAGL